MSVVLVGRSTLKNSINPVVFSRNIHHILYVGNFASDLVTVHIQAFEEPHGSTLLKSLRDSPQAHL
jgi:hypothetical protein